MTVLIVESGSSALRGDVRKWLLEVKAGVYVGRLTASVRDQVWQRVCLEVTDGAVVMIETADTEQGYRYRLWGVPTRIPEYFDGLLLIRRLR